MNDEPAAPLTRTGRRAPLGRPRRRVRRGRRRSRVEPAGPPARHGDRGADARRRRSRRRATCSPSGPTLDELAAARLRDRRWRRGPRPRLVADGSARERRGARLLARRRHRGRARRSSLGIASRRGTGLIDNSKQVATRRRRLGPANGALAPTTSRIARSRRDTTSAPRPTPTRLGARVGSSLKRRGTTAHAATAARAQPAHCRPPARQPVRRPTTSAQAAKPASALACERPPRKSVTPSSAPVWPVRRPLDQTLGDGVRRPPRLGVVLVASDCGVPGASPDRVLGRGPGAAASPARYAARPGEDHERLDHRRRRRHRTPSHVARPHGRTRPRRDRVVVYGLLAVLIALPALVLRLVGVFRLLVIIDRATSGPHGHSRRNLPDRGLVLWTKRNP